MTEEPNSSLSLSREDYLGELPDDFFDKLPDGAKIYAVGGSVRDRFLPDLEPRELDLLITGICEDELLPLLNRFGKARRVGRSFSVIKWYPRKVNPLRPIDVSIPSSRGLGSPKKESEITLEEDLGGRDFTVNAMAFDLAAGELIDPFSGRDDLRKGILRRVSPDSLFADPLRCLRAAYLAARCGLSPETDTLKNIQKAADKLPEVAPERIAEELKKLLLVLEKPSRALKLWRDWEILPIVLPELAEGVGVTQEGGWHAWGVFEHNLATADAAPRKLDVRLAALFHDCGKPRRRRYHPERDRATFYGHQSVGERMARKALERLRFSGELIERVGTLIRNHMFNHAETDRGVRRFIRRVGEDLLDEIFELRFADIRAQGTGRDETADREYKKRVQKILAARPPLTSSDLAIGGHDIMEEFHISEGPKVGKILGYLLEAVIDDPEVNRRAALMDLARDFIRSGNID